MLCSASGCAGQREHTRTRWSFHIEKAVRVANQKRIDGKGAEGVLNVGCENSQLLGDVHALVRRCRRRHSVAREQQRQENNSSRFIARCLNFRRTFMVRQAYVSYSIHQ